MPSPVINKNINDNLMQIYNRHKRVVDNITWPDKFETHSYGEVYEEWLSEYRTTAKNILEIGILGGESLLMWEEYFTGKVYGIDCSEQPLDGQFDLRPLINSGHNIVIMDASSKSDTYKWCNFKFDVIIEDAGHSVEQQFAIYNNFKPYIADKGIYIIEDIQDIDKTIKAFQNIDKEKNIIIIDRRKVKGRYDDVMVVIK